MQWVQLEASALHSTEFSGVLASWKQKMAQTSKKVFPSKTASDLTVAEIIGGLKPTQLWSVLVALATLLAGAFALGGKFFGAQ